MLTQLPVGTDLYQALQSVGADEASLTRVSDLLDEHEDLTRWRDDVRDAFENYRRDLITLDELAYEIGG